jgi:hypothetical protein
MADRRQFITGIATVSTVGIGGCVGTGEETEPEEVSVVLPPNSSLLFVDGSLTGVKFVDGETKERNFPAGSFSEDEVGTRVSEFDLANADTSDVKNMQAIFTNANSFNQDIGAWDTSNVENMQAMFNNANSFNQDISMWCVEQIGEKPTSFNSGAEFRSDEAKQPNWGESC